MLICDTTVWESCDNAPFEGNKIRPQNFVKIWITWNVSSLVTCINLTLNIRNLLWWVREWWHSLFFTWLQFIDENAEENDSNSDDDDVDSTSERESEGGDAVSVKISSLKIADQVLTCLLNIFRVKCVSKLCPLLKLSSSFNFLKLSVFQIYYGGYFSGFCQCSLSCRDGLKWAWNSFWWG